MTAAIPAKSAAESDQRDLLAVIHASIPSGVAFTSEHPAIREWIDARQLTGTNREHEPGGGGVGLVQD
ncbi:MULTISPECIES: hypothetical protein [unclassified Luteococcus]|uniref:hypothetical protein n=1 Tax=unclassified Luteococcus TaxID=2639923 RepID=UPI00313C97A3